MAVEAVVFDIGETLIDETMMWTRAAANAGVTPFTLMGVLGATIEPLGVAIGFALATAAALAIQGASLALVLATPESGRLGRILSRR